MIKLIGAILLIAGTASWGISGVFRLRSRCASLNSLTNALGIMQSEICDRLTPMPELLVQLAEETSYPASLLFKNASTKMTQLGGERFATIWIKAVEATPELLLAPPEALVLSELGASLGRYYVEEQRGAISHAARKMDEFTRKAEAARDTNSRMHAFLGVAAGIFAVVILI